MAAHRGRFQAQGGGLEKSVKWDQETPLTDADAHQMLEQLRSQLTDREYQLRAELFRKAHERIDAAARYGGMVGMNSCHFGLRPNRSIRIDIEVSAGTAFVRNPRKGN